MFARIIRTPAAQVTSKGTTCAIAAGVTCETASQTNLLEQGWSLHGAAVLNLKNPASGACNCLRVRVWMCVWTAHGATLAHPDHKRELPMPWRAKGLVLGAPTHLVLVVSCGQEVERRAMVVCCGRPAPQGAVLCVDRLKVNSLRN
eukprot:scaffold114446_cov15-Tisochrysis_lutea.AAC.3